MEEIKEHKHILVCGDNFNSLNILRSLGEKGICPMAIIQQEEHIPLLAKSKYIGEIIWVNCYEDALSKLMVYADEVHPPFIYLTDDNHLQMFDEHYDELNGKFYFFNAGTHGRLTHYLQKEQQCLLAEQCGLHAPKFEEVARGELPTTLSYPIITKTNNSYSSGWKRDVTICYSPEELKEAYEHMVSERLLLQEYVEKTGEYSMQGISINGGESVYMPFERMYLRYTKTSFGGYMYYQPFKDMQLQEKVQKMLREIGFTGCFEVEFLVDKDLQLHFLEINLRFSASNYGVNNGGVNLPYLWAQSTLSQSIVTQALNIRKDRYFVINEIVDIASAKRVGVFTWIKQLLSADGYYLYNKQDKRPCCSWLWSRFQLVLKHRISRKR